MAFNLPRDMICLAPNYQGYFHGVKASGLTVAEQEFVQSVFKVMYGEPTNLFSSLEEFIKGRKAVLDQLNQQRNDLLRQNQAVVMKPAEPPEMPGASPFPVLKTIQDRFKRTLGSVIGKITTFGRTQITGQPRGTVDPSIQQQIQKNDGAIQQTKQVLDYYMGLLAKNQEHFKNIPNVSKDPYVFYHSFLKGFIGNNKRMKQIYRKFELSKIQSPRIIKTVGVVPGGNIRQ